MLTDKQVDVLAQAIKSAGQNIAFVGFCLLLMMVSTQCSNSVMQSDTNDAIHHVARSNEQIAREIDQLGGVIYRKDFYDPRAPDPSGAIRELSTTLRQTLPVRNSLAYCTDGISCETEGEQCYSQQCRHVEIGETEVP